jgi:hypothetical protein
VRVGHRMIRRRGVIPVLLLLVLVVFGAVAQTVRGPAAAPSGAPAATTPTPTPVPTTGPARAVARSLAAVERAFNAGDVRLLCRSGALVDPAVIRQQSALRGGCESELEELIANRPPIRLAVRRLTLRRDLATVAVATPGGAGVAVDFVRNGRRWLLSFSNGNDPMPALMGSAA